MEKKSKDLRILYIDDNKSMVKLFSLLSEEYQFEALIAYTMNEGIEVARKKKPDIIITDIYMPDGDGFTLSANLKKDITTYSIPIIGCSITFFQKGKRIFLVGADKFVNEKPYSIERLNYILEGIAPKLCKK